MNQYKSIIENLVPLSDTISTTMNVIYGQGNKKSMEKNINSVILKNMSFIDEIFPNKNYLDLIKSEKGLFKINYCNVEKKNIVSMDNFLAVITGLTYNFSKTIAFKEGFPVFFEKYNKMLGYKNVSKSQEEIDAEIKKDVLIITKDFIRAIKNEITKTDYLVIEKTSYFLRRRLDELVQRNQPSKIKDEIKYAEEMISNILINLDIIYEKSKSKFDYVSLKKLGVAPDKFEMSVIEMQLSYAEFIIESLTNLTERNILNVRVLLTNTNKYLKDNKNEPNQFTGIDKFGSETAISYSDLLRRYNKVLGTENTKEVLNKGSNYSILPDIDYHGINIGELPQIVKDKDQYEIDLGVKRENLVLTLREVRDQKNWEEEKHAALVEYLKGTEILTQGKREEVYIKAEVNADPKNKKEVKEVLRRKFSFISKLTEEFKAEVIVQEVEDGIKTDRFGAKKLVENSIHIIVIVNREIAIIEKISGKNAIESATYIMAYDLLGIYAEADKTFLRKLMTSKEYQMWVRNHTPGWEVNVREDIVSNTENSKPAVYRK